MNSAPLCVFVVAVVAVVVVVVVLFPLLLLLRPLSRASLSFICLSFTLPPSLTPPAFLSGAV